MRLGMIAALIFIVLSFGIYFSGATNQSLITESVEQNMEAMMTATKVTQEGSFGVGNFITLVGAGYTYFDSLVGIAWSAFDNPLFVSGGWAFVPYFTVSPFMVVLFFGLIILLIGVLTKTF